jgi:hypothetical protein
MKDAHGHGSEGRQGGARAMPFGLAGNFGAASKMKSDHDYKSGGDSAVAHLRSQLASAESGAHRGAILQGIRNILGR